MVSFLIGFGHRFKSNEYWGSAKISSILCLKLDELSWNLKREYRSSVLKGPSQKTLIGLATLMVLRIEKRYLRAYAKERRKTVHLGIGRGRTETEKLYII